MILPSSTKILAVMGALSLHGVVVAIILQPEPPRVKPQAQIIKVNVVAPTIIAKQNTDKIANPEIVKTASVKSPPQKKGMVKLENPLKPKPQYRKQQKPQQTPTEEIKPAQDKQQIQQLTSGLTSPEASQKISVITKPVAANYLNNPPPHYPKRAQRHQQQGTVLLDVRVKTDGKPKAVMIAKSSGYRSLDQAALKAVRRWEFIPARRGSRPIEANVEVPITFKIQ